jgi:hypothetical protein
MDEANHAQRQGASRRVRHSFIGRYKRVLNRDGANGTVGNTTITTTSMPSHKHTLSTLNGAITLALGNGEGFTTVRSHNDLAEQISMANNGSDGAHNHTITLGVQYVDLIIASKD